jgi:hypothetical protein
MTTVFAILFFVLGGLFGTWAALCIIYGGTGGSDTSERSVKVMWYSLILGVICGIIGFILI